MKERILADLKYVDEVSAMEKRAKNEDKDDFFHEDRPDYLDLDLEEEEMLKEKPEGVEREKLRKEFIEQHKKTNVDDEDFSCVELDIG